jgi:group I intron endonuclease
MPINYAEGKVYKIYNTINDDIYVGSTTLKLCERMTHHRRCLNTSSKKHRSLYKSMSENGVYNFFIELIEKCPCNGKEELLKKEGEYIRSLKPSLNRCIAGRTSKEYHKDNKEYIRELKSQYYQINKDYCREKLTCECGCVVTRGCLSRHRKTKKHIQLMSKLN